MGSFRTRVKNKGKRWIKGHSSISNPVSRTFRNSATNNFFKDDTTDGNQGSLTVDSLRRHDDLINVSFDRDSDLKSAVSDSKIIDADNCTSYNGSVNTFYSFATNQTCCTNIAFNKLVERLGLASAHHKEMWAVHAAVIEVIQSKEQQENTEPRNSEQGNTAAYFCALVTTLDSISLEDGNDDSVSAIVSLLSMCIKSVSKGILQHKFSFISKTFMRYLEHYADSDNNIILRSLLSCSAFLLRAQEGVVWNDTSTFTIYDAILAFIVHTKSKIRKAGQHAILAILKASSFCKNEDPSSHPAAAHTAKYCIRILEDSISQGGITTVNHMLNLLKEIIGIFPKAQLKTCCETVLKLMTLKNAIVTSLGFQTFFGLFSSRPSSNCCPATLNAQIITALYDYQPSTVDVQATIAWLAAMQEAFSNLASNDLSLCVSNAPKFFHVCASTLLSEKVAIIESAARGMQAIIKNCVEPSAAEDKVDQFVESIQKIFEILSGCLKYEYHAAWRPILISLSKLYKACGKTCHSFMIDCLKSLADLRETDEFPYANEIDVVFGCAIESIGPLIIMKEIPLQISQNEKIRHEIKRTWLLPLLKQHVKHSTLKCFVDLFLPMAIAFRTRSEALKKANDKVGAVTYDLLQSQIWSLLPSFCNDAQDIRETFPTIAKPIGSLLSTRKDLRSTAMAALRRLISTCTNSGKDVDIIAKFAKNYIPILFNIYTTECKGTDEEATRVACLETIKLYLSVADSALLEDLFSRALQKLESEEAAKSDFTKKSILDVTRLLLQYQNPKLLQGLFENQICKVRDIKNFKEEKKYYRLLEDLCSCHSEKCNDYISQNFATIKNLLVETASSASLPSRGPRIRTAKALLFYDASDETIMEFLPEAIMCCKDGNKRCRFSAFELVTEMATLMRDRHGKAGLAKYLDALSSGLVGDTAMIAASILALTTTVHCCKDDIDKEQFDVILNNICLLATSKTREIVGPAIGYLKLVTLMNGTNLNTGCLDLIVKTLTNINDDCKRKFRQKVHDLYDRMMRKYGAATIISLVPTHDRTLIRLKAIKKEQDRKMRRKKEARESEAKNPPEADDEFPAFSAKQKSKTINEILAECDDEDDMLSEDDDDKKTNRKQTKRSQVYLKEDVDSIMDFTSSAANKNITTKYPAESSHAIDGERKRKKKVEFPTAPDGRLIILEEKKPEVFPSAVENNSDVDSIASDAEAETNLSQMLKKVGISRKRKISDVADEQPTKYQAGGSGIHRKVKKNSIRNSNTGEIYEAKKAKGDVKRKGKLDPFAYIPLSRNALNRRKKKKSAGQFNNIVRSAKKGVSEGSKLKFKNKNKKRGK